MPETHDYAKLGQTTYHARGIVWPEDPNESWVEVGGGEYKTVPAAKLAACSWMAKGAAEFTIERGTYVDNSFDDDDYRHVRDAEWQHDENWIINGQLNGNGGIEWTEESW